MSVFANRCIRVMAAYDKLFSMSATHRTLFLLNHAKYDNWRHGDEHARQHLFHGRRCHQ